MAIALNPTWCRGGLIQPPPVNFLLPRLNWYSDDYDFRWLFITFSCASNAKKIFLICWGVDPLAEVQKFGVESKMSENDVFLPKMLFFLNYHPEILVWWLQNPGNSCRELPCADFGTKIMALGQFWIFAVLGTWKSWFTSNLAAILDFLVIWLADKKNILTPYLDPRGLSLCQIWTKSVGKFSRS